MLSLRLDSKSTDSAGQELNAHTGKGGALTAGLDQEELNANYPITSA